MWHQEAQREARAEDRVQGGGEPQIIRLSPSPLSRADFEFQAVGDSGCASGQNAFSRQRR